MPREVLFGPVSSGALPGPTPAMTKNPDGAKALAPSGYPAGLAVAPAQLETKSPSLSRGWFGKKVTHATVCTKGIRQDDVLVGEVAAFGLGGPNVRLQSIDPARPGESGIAQQTRARSRAAAKRGLSILGVMLRLSRIPVFGANRGGAPALCFCVTKSRYFSKSPFKSILRARRFRRGPPESSPKGVCGLRYVALL